MRNSQLIGNLVSTFFDHVSNEASYALPDTHPLRTRVGNGFLSNRPSTDTVSFADFYVNERATGFASFDGNPANQRDFLAGQCILMQVASTSKIIGEIEVLATLAADDPAVFVKMTDTATPLQRLDEAGAEVGPLLINDRLVSDPDGAYGDFPAFTLFASLIDQSLAPVEDPQAYPTIRLFEHAGGNENYGNGNTALLPKTGSDAVWLIWMRIDADAPKNSGVRLTLNGLVQGK